MDLKGGGVVGEDLEMDSKSLRREWEQCTVNRPHRGKGNLYDVRGTASG